MRHSAPAQGATNTRLVKHLLVRREVSFTVYRAKEGGEDLLSAALETLPVVWSTMCGRLKIFKHIRK